MPKHTTEELIAWVKQGAASTPSKPSKTKRPTQPTPDGLPRYIPLKVWAQLMFGEHAPHPNTIAKWVQDGRIYPPPKKIGNAWYVSPQADYLSD